MIFFKEKTGTQRILSKETSKIFYGVAWEDFLNYKYGN